MSRYFHNVLRKIRGQQFVEYLLLFGVTVLVGYFALSKGGFFRTSVEDSLDETIEGVGCMAAETCPAGGCAPVCGDGCCEPVEKDDCNADCGCSPVNGDWSGWVVDGPCTGCQLNYTRTCSSPTPKCGGANCTGPSTKSEACGTLDGIWGGAWVDVGACSACLQRQELQTCIGAACGGNCSGPFPFQNVACGKIEGAWGGPWVNIGSCGDPGPCLQEQEKQQCLGAQCGGTCPGYRPRQAVPCGGAFGTWSGPWVKVGACQEFKSCLQKWEKDQCWGDQCGAGCTGAKPEKWTACGSQAGGYGSWYDSSNCFYAGGIACNKTQLRDCNNPAPMCGGATCPPPNNRVVGCMGIWVKGDCSGCATLGLSYGGDENGFECKGSKGFGTVQKTSVWVNVPCCFKGICWDCGNGYFDTQVTCSGGSFTRCHCRY